MKNTLEIDLNKIFKLSKKREKENTDFRIFLKGEDSKKVDKIVFILEYEQITIRNEIGVDWMVRYLAKEKDIKIDVR